MKRWPIKKLGELVDFIGGGTPRRNQSEFWGGEIPWASVKDLQSQTLEMTLEKITPAGLTNSASNLIPKGTVIIASRVGLGKVVINEIPVAINQDLKALIPRSGHLEPRYLLRFLLSKAKYFERIGVGATVKGLTIADYQKLEIPVPPLVEQKQIVELLDETDTLRKLRTQADRRTAEFVPALFNEMFGDPATNPKHWPLRPFSAVGSLDRGRSKHRPRNEPSLYGGKYPFIQTGDVANSNGEIRTYNQMYSEKGLAQSRMWPAGTLVITIAANIGKTAILTFPTCFPDSMVGFVPNEKVHIDYVRQWLVSIEDSLDAMASQVAQKNINLEILRELKIPVPPLPLQKEFAKRVKEVRELETAQAASRRRTEDLFQSMLYKTFNGEI
jgi:type I restriction enzyme S subunit